MNIGFFPDPVPEFVDRTWTLVVETIVVRGREIACRRRVWLSVVLYRLRDLDFTEL